MAEGPSGYAERAPHAGWARRLDRRTFAVVAVAALLLLSGLGSIDLWAPDEPRYAEIAEELRRQPNGPLDLVVLRLNGEVYTQKPPLYYWLAAAVGAARGRVDEVAARLPSAAAGVLVVALTAALGRSLLGSRRAGLIAAAVLLTMPRFVHQARRAQLDVLLALFETLALAAYSRIECAQHDDRRPSRGALALLHAAVGGALLTKGPVGALPWLVIVVHRLWARRAASLPALFPAWGIALALAPTLGWLAAVTWLSPAGFFGDAVIDNVLARFFTGTDHVRPITYYLTRLPLDTLPWSPLAVVGGVVAWRERNDADPRIRGVTRLLLGWSAVFVVFFSVSAGKRGVYMVPLFPCIAVLSALALDRWLELGSLPRAVTLSGASLLAALPVAALWIAHGTHGPTGTLASELVPGPVILLIGVIGALGAVATAALRSRGVTPIYVFASAVLAFEVAALAYFYPALDYEKSPRPVAIETALLTSTRERIGVFRNGALTGGLEYYSGRRVVALETDRDVNAFHTGGGRIVVVRERDAETLGQIAPMRTRASARSGRRRLLVVELDAEQG